MSSSGKYRTRGRGLQNRGEHEQAIVEFTRALFLEPNDVVTYMHRAKSLFHLLDFRAAATNLRKVLQLASERAGGADDDELEAQSAEYRRRLAAIFDAMGSELIKRHLRTPAGAQGRPVKSGEDDVNDVTSAVSFFGEAISTRYDATTYV